MINDQSVLQGIPDNVTISDLSKYIVRTNRNYDLPIIVSAYEFAFQAHGDQKRSSGEPYIVHPLSVAWILVSLGMDTECVCAGLLHDVVEDTGHTLDDICKLFGQNIGSEQGRTADGKRSENAVCDVERYPNHYHQAGRPPAQYADAALFTAGKAKPNFQGNSQCLCTDGRPVGHLENQRRAFRPCDYVS